jgi:hypothetical protein
MQGIRAAPDQPVRAGRAVAYLGFLRVLSRPTANVPLREHPQNRIDFLGDLEGRDLGAVRISGCCLQINPGC